MTRERKNNVREIKTVQDGGLIKKQREVNMNVGAKVVHGCKKREQRKMRERGASELHSSSGMSDFLLVHLISKWRDKTVSVHYR